MNTRVSIVEQIIDALVLHIENNRLEPGAKMPTEKEVCEMLGVGRSTVREAYKVMQTRGIVDPVRGKGMFLSHARPQDGMSASPFGDKEMRIGDYMDVRAAIETTSVRLAIQRASEAQIAQLEGIQRRLVEGLEQGDVRKMADMDEAFHTTIAEIAGNPLLIQVQDIVAKYFKSFRVRSFSNTTNRAHVMHPHSMIIQAFHDRNSELGVLVMTQHLQQSFDDIKKLLPPSEAQA